MARARGLSSCAGDHRHQGSPAGRDTPKQQEERTSVVSLFAGTLVLPVTGTWASSSNHHCPGIPREFAHAGDIDTEGMRNIPSASLSKIPCHVVSGHLSWHGVALDPSLYLPCSSSFLEPLLYRISSIPST